MEEKLYVSSDGTKKEVSKFDYQYLVNALAKAYRNLNEAETYSDWVKNMNNLHLLTKELQKRNEFYFNTHFGGER